MIVADRIKSRMAEQGLSQSELARRVGVTQATIFRLVSGQAYGSTHLHKIARELRTTPAYLAGETDDPDADAPAEPELTPDEAELVSIFRQLPKADQDALSRVAERMIGPRTFHDRRDDYEE